MTRGYCWRIFVLVVPLFVACGGGGSPTSPSRAQESVVVTVSDSTVISGATWKEAHRILSFPHTSETTDGGSLVNREEVPWLQF
jgi:hypothetical protein